MLFRSKPAIAATYYGKPTVPEFAELVHDEARKYNALVVPDRKGVGLDLVNRLIDHRYPAIWRDVLRDRMGDQMTERIGYDINVRTRTILVNKLIEVINGGIVDITCERIRAEINDFHYNDERKPEHLPGCHDDMLFAFALALVGASQRHANERLTYKRRPVTIDEIRAFRATTKKHEADCRFEDDPDWLKPDFGIASVHDELEGFGAARVLGMLNRA